MRNVVVLQKCDVSASAFVIARNKRKKKIKNSKTYYNLSFNQFSIYQSQFVLKVVSAQRINDGKYIYIYVSPSLTIPRLHRATPTCNAN